MWRWAEQGARGKVYDLDTGQEVREVRGVDVEGGLVEAYHLNPDGSKRRDAAGDYLWYVARGRFAHHRPECRCPRCTGRSVANDRGVVMGAAACALCRSALTLPGDDLCVRCRASQGGRNWIGAERHDDPLDPHPCETCKATATWSVGDEVKATPQQTQGIVTMFGVQIRNPYWDRGAMVRRRYYCDRHYQAPRLLDAKGEIIEELETAGPRG